MKTDRCPKCNRILSIAKRLYMPQRGKKMKEEYVWLCKKSLCYKESVDMRSKRFKNLIKKHGLKEKKFKKAVKNGTLIELLTESKNEKSNIQNNSKKQRRARSKPRINNRNKMHMPSVSVF